MQLRRLNIGLALVCLTASAGFARQDDGVGPAAMVEANVDDSDAALTGLLELELMFTPYEDFDRAWAVRVELSDGARALAQLDHAPTPPTSQWKKDKVVRYTLPCAMPFDALAQPGRELDVRIGFVDPKSGKLHAPGESFPLVGPLGLVTSFTVPRLEPVESKERVAALVAAARERKGKSSPADAWAILELGIRVATEDAFKYELRDEILALGHFPPRAISQVESAIVDHRIREERERYLRLVAGRMFDAREFHGALLLLAEVGGSLEEQAGKAVLGALADAERVAQDADGVKKALFEYLPPEQSDEVFDVIQKLGATQALLDQAEAWRKKQRFAAARRALRALISGESTHDLMERGRAALEALEKEWLAAVPEAERAKAQAAIDHPVFQRTVAVASHRFIYIGPKVLVESLPLDSTRRFDLAYVFLTDLFGRVPNPEGDRVTVYFKELWDFGGGVGGGKIIDIGNADHKAKGTRVDNGLLYHELTHCIDDTNPIFAGFREGLANFGAAYAFEALAQQEDSLHSFRGNLEAFEKEYLARDLEYWRIQNYGPSAGFFLSFVERHAKTKDGHDWKPYRQFFREYRAAPIRDGREPYVARALAYYLMRAFGPAVFDDLVRYRYPLKESDRAILADEIESFEAGGSLSPFKDDAAFSKYRGSPLPRDLRTDELLRLADRKNGDSAAALEYARNELGIITDWRVIGPFPADGADPLACPFPPESLIDFAAQYPTPHNLVQWGRPSDHIPLTLRPTGWVEIEYPYQDNTAIYAATVVTAPAETAAFVHLRVDDDFALFLNGERTGSYLDRGSNGSTMVTWRGPRREVPDAMRLPVVLRAGANTILLKIRNRHGLAGFALALAADDGSPLSGLSVDSAACEGRFTPQSKEPNWKKVFTHSFRNKAFAGKFDITVGAFKVRDGALRGETTSGAVEWRKYTVRPGFPKDSPSNLAWLAKDATKGLEDFRLEIDFADATPQKFLVTFQGEGGRDGLSGWTLILEPWGGKVRASLERYDRLVLQSLPTQPTGKHPEKLVVQLLAGQFSVTLGDARLIDGLPIRPIRLANGEARDRIGFATWGAEPRIAAIELAR
jgi:hypothetical protein